MRRINSSVSQSQASEELMKKEYIKYTHRQKRSFRKVALKQFVIAALLVSLLFMLFFNRVSYSGPAPTSKWTRTYRYQIFSVVFECNGSVKFLRLPCLRWDFLFFIKTSCTETGLARVIVLLTILSNTSRLVWIIFTQWVCSSELAIVGCILIQTLNTLVRVLIRDFKLKFQLLVLLCLLIQGLKKSVVQMQSLFNCLLFFFKFCR